MHAIRLGDRPAQNSTRTCTGPPPYLCVSKPAAVWALRAQCKATTHPAGGASGIELSDGKQAQCCRLVALGCVSAQLVAANSARAKHCSHPHLRTAPFTRPPSDINAPARHRRTKQRSPPPPLGSAERPSSWQQRCTGVTACRSAAVEPRPLTPQTNKADGLSSATGTATRQPEAAHARPRWRHQQGALAVPPTSPHTQR
jgi:hypothetical protein